MKILSIGNNPKLGKDNIFISLWESFQSLNFFVRVYILTGILIVASTPFIVGNIQTFKQQGSTLTPLPPSPTSIIPPQPISPTLKPKEQTIQTCADGTLYNKCSPNKPNYCENGALKERSSVCGCPENYKDSGDVCSPLLNAQEVIVFQERNAGDFFIPPSKIYEWWQINQSKFLNQFYQVHGDHYDFLALFPMKPGQNHNSAKINYNIQGLGLDPYLPNPHTKKLKAIARLEFHKIWSDPLFNHKEIDRIFMQTILHEIAHYWCCAIKGMGPVLPAHWNADLDLFSGDTTIVDMLGYGQWIIKDGKSICVSINDDTKKLGFAPLTLYLMGLIPKEDVPPIYRHEPKLNPGESYGPYGPICKTDYPSVQTHKITIADIIEANGERVPSYQNSQRNFRIAFVVVVPANETIDPLFIEYVELYKKSLPQNWKDATLQNSIISF